MKKIFTLLTAACIGSFAFGQTVFQSNFENWTSSAPITPTDFVGLRTNISLDSITQVSTGNVYGTYAVQLQNTGPSGKRFSTQPVAVTAGTTYEIKFWAKGSGDLGTRLYTSGYLGSVTYETINSTSWTMYSHTVTADVAISSAEFLFYVKASNNTNSHIQIDSVHIGVGTPPTTTIKKIYDIQYTTAPSGDSPEVGNIVTTKGVITGIVKNGPDRHAFFIQDSAKAWNGLYIYERNDSTLAIGDSVQVTGTVAEFNGTTELTFVSNITVLNSSNTLPTAVLNTTLNANNEEWEGVLINVVNAQCVNTTGGFGIWEINDGSGILKADDDIFFYHTTAVVGTNYDVRGIGHYSFGDFKILPRDFNDISLSTGINELEKASVNVYPNPANEVLNFDLNVTNATIQLFDITGKSLKTVVTNKNMFSVSLTGFNNGIYFYSITDAGGNKIATNRFIVAK